MGKFSKILKKAGFTFSFKRLKKALLLVILFILIGVCVYFLLKYNSSDTAQKKIYVEEISQIFDLEDNNIIRVYKKDINSDNNIDYAFIMAKGEEVYTDVTFVYIDGADDTVVKYETSASYNSDVTLKITEDENGIYFLISDTSGNANILRLKEDLTLVDIAKNTASDGLLGYTITTNKADTTDNTLEVTLDNYSKEDYLEEFTDTVTLDFDTVGIDISKYRETYLRDKISKFELTDIDEDGTLELVTTQYILYNLDDDATSDKTLGKVQVYYTIQDDKLVYNKVEVNI